MVAGPSNLRSVAVTVPRLLVSRCLIRYHVLDFGAHVLHGAATTEVVRAARLPSAVPLALHYLSADRRLVLLLLLAHGLVDVHRGLDMVTSSAAHSRHLNILHLGLIDARALPGEELLLPSYDSVLHLV